MTSLTLDLRGGDAEIKNPAMYTEDTARQLLTVFVDGLANDKLNALLDSLDKDDTFKNYPQLLEEFRRSAD